VHITYGILTELTIKQLHMAERYFEGKHFHASAKKAEEDKNENERRDNASEISLLEEKADKVFLEQYDIPEMIESIYEELYGEGQQPDVKIKKRLEKHLIEEFGKIDGDTNTISDMLKAEISKFLKLTV
jgi:pectin methylesterase-like acyl-CoA thioesterase